jgi:intracellular septation protein
LKLLFDLFPIMLFFAAYKLKGIFVATAVAIGACVLQILWSWFKKKKVDAMLWVSLAIVGVFGSATLLLHNEVFIKWKPTVLYAVLSGTLLLGRLVFKKNFLQKLLGSQVSMPAAVWEKLNISWGIFFALLSGLNIFIAYTFSTDIWVNFKLFGAMGLIFVFVVIQSFFLAPYMEKDGKQDPQ